jgi:predicted nucleic acid-binding protein
VETTRDTRVVCDAGPLIHLQQLTAIDLLDFAEVFVPEAVWHEVLRHEPDALQAATVRFSRVENPSSLDPALEALGRGLALGQGELAAIGVAQQQTGYILLTDDAAARLASESLRLRVHGTIGVILRSLRTGHRSATQVIELLEAVPSRSTLHIRKNILDEAIRQVRELYP